MSISLIIYILILIIVVCLLGSTGIILILKGLKNKSPNLHILGISFILMVIDLFVAVIGLILWLYHLINLMIHVCILYFVRKTFKTENKVIYIMIQSIYLILFIGIYYFILGFSLFHTFEQTINVRFSIASLLNINNFIVFFWYSMCAFKSYKNLKKEKIEPWILVRIKLVSFSSFVFMFLYVSEFLRIYSKVEIADPNEPISIFCLYMTLIIASVYSICQYLAWVMPKRFKNCIMKGKDTIILDNKKLSEEEIFKMLRRDLENA